MDTEKTLAACWPRKKFLTGSTNPPVEPTARRLGPAGFFSLDHRWPWARRLGAALDPLDPRDEPPSNNVHRRPPLSD